MQVGPSITADVLILQAGVEIFVENDAMGRFFSSLGYAMSSSLIALILSDIRPFFFLHILCVWFG